MTRTASEAMEAWVAARAANDYAAFRPWLDRQLELKHEYLDCFETTADPYDQRGDFSALGTWLRENLYSLGRKLTPKETLERVAGGPIDPEPYLRYLQSKHGPSVTA